jgi:hypothetical protein
MKPFAKISNIAALAAIFLSLALSGCGEHSLYDVFEESSSSGASSSSRVSSPSSDSNANYLLTTEWSQRAPYDNQMPLINGEKSFTGCSATAMAQILNYHQHPKGTLTATIPAYTTSTHGLEMSAVNSGTIAFDWANMKDKYSENSYTAAEANAVATLMSVAGKSIEIDYRDDGSSALISNMPYALTAYFGYSPAKYIERAYYSDNEWVSILKQQIELGLPVVYSGHDDSRGKGHTWILDGYDSDGKFHMNWGWGNSSHQPNGFHDILASDLRGYSQNQKAVINIKPMPNIALTGTGTESSPFIITTAEQLAYISAMVFAGKELYKTAHYKLGNNINISAANWQSIGIIPTASWLPIGTPKNPFRGIFDGNGKVISGLTINGTNDYDYYQRLFGNYYQGLFGYISGGTVKNLGIEGIAISSGGRLGGIAAIIESGSIISNCYTTGAITGDYDTIGGIVGLVGDGGNVVENCYSTVAVSGVSHIGGIAGYINAESMVKNNAALNPKIVGGSYIGRISTNGSASISSNNIAFAGMLNSSGTTEWSYKGLTARNGADITAAQINADGTLGGRFTTANGWTVQNGKLPGFGKAVEMPEHIK